MDETTWAGAVDAAREVRVVVLAETGTVRTPIWIVGAGGAAYVRSYRAEAGQWYRYVRSAGRFVLEIAGEDVEVDPVAIDDTGVLAAVSDAYLHKYAGEAETDDMVRPAVVATTLRLDPVA